MDHYLARAGFQNKRCTDPAPVNHLIRNRLPRSSLVQRVMLADTCAEELDTAELYVDGFQLGDGGDADFDTSGGVWYATWTVTLSGRLKTQTQEEN